MPLYDFYCGYCNKKFKDIKVPRDISWEITCSKCGETLKRIFPLPSEPRVKGGTKKFHRRGNKNYA